MPFNATSAQISSLLAALKQLRESCLAMEQQFGRFPKLNVIARGKPHAD
jgi:hypothetical protein